MKFVILVPFVFSMFVPAFADEHKMYKEEDFEKIKLMKIEYLRKRINCVKASSNFKEMNKCWKKRKKH